MRLNDNNNVKQVGKHAGGFMYRSQFIKRPDERLNKQKFSLLPSGNTIFDDEPIEFNDLDLNILNRNLIKFVPTDALRIELMLERAEKRLDKVYEEIKASKLLEINEPDHEEFLEKKKNRLLYEINSYRAEYRQLGIIYKYVDIFADFKNIIIRFLMFLKKLFYSLPFAALILNKIPGFKEKQKIKKLSLLHGKISRELKKNVKIDHDKLEYLLLKTEEFGIQPE